MLRKLLDHIGRLQGTCSYEPSMRSSETGCGLMKKILAVNDCLKGHTSMSSQMGNERERNNCLSRDSLLFRKMCFLHISFCYEGNMNIMINMCHHSVTE
jgi:hypothetical protein